MKGEELRQVEARIQACVEQGQINDAVDLAIRTYGGELFGFIVNTIHDEALAKDVFQQASLEIWKSLPSFRWSSSFRTWVYTIVRRTTFHALKAPDRRHQHLRTEDEAKLQANWMRTSTMEWQKTENRDRFWLLCESLEPEQRTLVMLRIGQRLSWAEIARIMSEDDDPTPESLRKVSAACRKRFERTKSQLKTVMKRDQ